MAKNRVKSLPQPPWVWGPSEVNEWIRATHPSQSREPRGRGRLAPHHVAMSARVWADAIEPVREVVKGVLESKDYTLEETANRIVAKKGKRHIFVQFRRSVLRDSVAVVARFDPPTLGVLPRHLLQALGERFGIASASVD